MVLIAHATVPNRDDAEAFAHAVAIAAWGRARLLSIYAHPDPDRVDEIPAAYPLLASWGRDLAAVEHERVVVDPGDSPMESVMLEAKRGGADLLVAATHHRGMLTRAFVASGAESLASMNPVPTLFVPVGGRSIVAPDGSAALRTIVVPVGDEEAARIGTERAGWFVDLLGLERATVELVYVGKEGTEPELPAADHPRLTFVQLTREGRVEQGVAQVGDHADLVIMPTRGSDSISDALFGTHTERVKRLLDCPLLSVPIPRP